LKNKGIWNFLGVINASTSKMPKVKHFLRGIMIKKSPSILCYPPWQVNIRFQVNFSNCPFKNKLSILKDDGRKLS
jgi:hypothetical protein